MGRIWRILVTGLTLGLYRPKAPPPDFGRDRDRVCAAKQECETGLKMVRFKLEGYRYVLKSLEVDIREHNANSSLSNEERINKLREIRRLRNLVKLLAAQESVLCAKIEEADLLIEKVELEKAARRLPVSDRLRQMQADIQSAMDGVHTDAEETRLGAEEIGDHVSLPLDQEQLDQLEREILTKSAPAEGSESVVIRFETNPEREANQEADAASSKGRARRKAKAKEGGKADGTLADGEEGRKQADAEPA